MIIVDWTSRQLLLAIPSVSALQPSPYNRQTSAMPNRGKGVVSKACPSMYMGKQKRRKRQGAKTHSNLRQTDTGTPRE
eukprot:4125680-Amphidinium_carterae.1